MKYEQTDHQVTTAELLQALHRQTLTETALELTNAGRDGWGDCGQGTWIMLDETKPGESLSEHRFFEEEAIHWLRHALPIRRQMLAGLPDHIQLVRPEGRTNTLTRDTSRHLTAFALQKAGFVYANTDGQLEVSAATYVASCFASGDIRNAEDRAATALLDSIDLDEERKQLRLLPLVTFDPEDKIGSWWALQSANIQKFNEEVAQDA